MNVDKMRARFICLLSVIVSIFRYSVRQGLAQRHSELIILAELDMSLTHEDHMRRGARIVVKGLLQLWVDAAKCVMAANGQQSKATGENAQVLLSGSLAALLHFDLLEVSVSSDLFRVQMAVSALLGPAQSGGFWGGAGTFSVSG